MNDEDAEKIPKENIPKNWTDHFDEAIRILNQRLLPALKFSPKELLLGLVVNTKPSDINTSTLPVTCSDTALQMAYVAQQRLDGYAEAVAHAIKRKSVFDKRVSLKNPGEVIFSKGQLVQIYRSDLDYTFKTERKLLPKWSTPQRIVSRHLNSYVLESLNGDPIPGTFSARRLRRFLPREGTRLAEEQKLVKERCAREEEAERREEAEEIEGEREDSTNTLLNPPDSTPEDKDANG